METRHWHIPKKAFAVIANLGIGGVWALTPVSEWWRPLLLFAFWLLLVFSCTGWVCANFDIIRRFRHSPNGKHPMTIIVVALFGAVVSVGLWLLINPLAASKPTPEVLQKELYEKTSGLSKEILAFVADRSSNIPILDPNAANWECDTPEGKRHSQETASIYSARFAAQVALVIKELFERYGLSDQNDLDLNGLNEAPGNSVRVRIIGERLGKLAERLKSWQPPTADFNAPGIVVVDVIRAVYPGMQLDFRVRNLNSVSVSISRIFLKILKVEKGISPIGKQEVSDTAEFLLDEKLRNGDVLQAPIAINVLPLENDRFIAKLRWSGKPQNCGYYYTMATGLKTSTGYVSGPLVKIHIQQQLWLDSDDSHPSPGNGLVLPSWDVPADEVAPAIDWDQEVKNAKPPL
jgi:hypothetical protein